MNEGEVKKRTGKEIIFGLFVKTIVIGFFVACVLLLRFNLDTGVAFATSTLFGTLNWFALSLILFGITDKKYQMMFFGVALKVIVLGFFFLVVLPTLVSNITALLIGFSLFLIVAFLESLSRVLLQYFATTKPSRPMPEFSLTSKRNAHDA